MSPPAQSGRNEGAGFPKPDCAAERGADGAARRPCHVEANLLGRDIALRFSVCEVGTSRCDVPARAERAERRRRLFPNRIAPLNSARTAQRAVPAMLRRIYLVGTSRYDFPFVR